MKLQINENHPANAGIFSQGNDALQLLEVKANLQKEKADAASLNGILLKEDGEYYNTQKRKGSNSQQEAKEHASPQWHYNLSKAKFYFSSQFIKILGIHEQPYYKYNVIESMMTKESQKEFVKGFNKVVYKRGNYKIKLDFIKTDGSLISVIQTGSPVINNDDKVTDIEGAVSFIPAEEKRDVAEVNKELLQQNKRLLSFADIASHNLRSHASNLQMTLQVLNHTSSEDETRFCIDSLQKISVALSQTITNIYELTKNEKLAENTITTVKFADVIRSVESSLALHIKESGAIIKTNFSNFPQITYVHAYIESILLNLISNAIKYKHPDRAPLIQISTYIENNAIYLKVQDNGSGIDLEKHAGELFKKNRTFHNHPDSRGVGLLITKNQVESMGGNISVESRLKIGTTFIVKLL